ncbi:hypothetical protein [Pseudocitrobacter corydidari]|uniref:Uncharacterized protein n=1 Tax=Pseudocitrobacter corydidari TaxID=2891570 RepID=A0ABY3SAQ7_9ENTR|nr:hypothetical protein [Pseudocitrobacter corydidari]UGS42715.1 hypothetical protein G163CM_34750 [Pseudocitrobacter corydidari]
MHLRLWILLIYILMNLSCIAASGHSGDWGRDGINMYNVPLLKHEGVKSPDGKITVAINDESLALKVGNRFIPLNVIFNPELSEVLWSSDSRYFTLTVSDGGWVGTWDTYVIDTKDITTPKIISLRPIIEAVLTKCWMCNGEDAINIGAVSWRDELRVIVEIPPHSVCNNMGEVKGAVIDVEHGNVIKLMRSEKVYYEWGEDMGKRFKE